MRFLTIPFFALAACATPRADMPTLQGADVEEQRKEVQAEALDDALARLERVERLAWPILTANTDLCPRTAPRLGFSFGDAKDVARTGRGLKERQVRALGWDDSVRVLTVAPGSPAAEAGLQPMDEITGVGGEDTETPADIGRAVEEALEDHEDEWPTITLRIRRGEAEEALTLTPARACDVAVVSSGRNRVNATASNNTLTIYAGLLRAVPDDNAIAFVIAHELAHWAGRHQRKVITNGIATGALAWAPPMLVTAQVLDLAAWPTARALGGQTPPFRTLTMRAAGGALRSPAFEREADYVGLYMHVRAGGSPQDVGEVFQTFSNISPVSSWLLATHPTTPERQLRLELAAEEIAAKRARGEALVPEGWESD